MSPFVGSNILAGAAGQGGADAGYTIQRSLRFNSADSAHLSRTPTVQGNRRTWTWAGWVKRTTLGSNGGIFSTFAGAHPSTVLFWNSEALNFHDYTGSYNIQLGTAAVFRDPSAWYHIVLAYDSTESTASDRAKLWVNGVLQTLSGTAVPSNFETDWNSTTEHNIGRYGAYLDSYLADVHFIDGQALAPTDFGEFDANNVWQAKEYTHNSPTTSSFTLADNDFTWSGLRTSSANTPDSGALTDGSLNYGDTFWGNNNANGSYLDIDMTGATDGETYSIRYWNAAEAGGQTITATCKQIDSSGNDISGTSSSQTWNQGQKWNTYIQTIASNCDKIRLIFSGNSSTNGWGIGEVEVNFIPSHTNDFYLSFSDNSSNAALGYDAAVDAPTLNPKGGMDVVTYTGNGGTQSISSLGFQPDLVWIKNKSANGSHDLYDSVRGADLVLNSDTTAAEYSGSGRLTSFNSSGFTLGSQSAVNINGGPFVAWCWRADGTSSSNTDGTITSQVSASTDYGFSIVTYQSNGTRGASIGHGLNTAPSWVIVKNRDSSYDWMVGHDGLGGWSNFIRLNTNGAKGSATSIFADTAPTSSVFYVGEDNTVNAGNSVQNYVAYCWSEVSGFSKFDGYSGDGNSGKKITTGFKPRFVVIKRTDTTENWHIFDSERGGTKSLFPDIVNGEVNDGSRSVVFVNDGFTLGTQGGINANGGTYIYAAFADRPGNNWDVNNLIATAGLETANQGFDVVTYTGNGSTQSITGLNFQPDFVWTSVRDATGYNKYLIDSVRGSTKVLISHKTDAESTQSTGITSFNSDGFSVGSNAQVNENGRSMVAWCWKAGGAASSNTDGTITSQVSANTTYGFSIVTYSGTLSNSPNPAPTVGHGLNAAPQLIISKSRNPNGDDGGAWYVNHTYNYDNWFRLNLTNAGQSIAASGGGTTVDPTSSVFSTYFIAGSNCNNNNYVAYCWSEVPGFSRFGSFTHASTTSLNLGFKPKFFLIKQTDGTTPWYLFDAERDSFDDPLFPNTNVAEASGFAFTANDSGISWVSGSLNAGTYIYAAFAGTPPGEIIDSLIDTPTNYERRH
jgi:hypothetical protein